MKKHILVILLGLVAGAASAQETLTLADCRDMAVRQSQDLEQARIKMEMAGYDRKIARANYFPKVSATGAYLYNDRDIALVNSDQSFMLQNAGTMAQSQLNAALAKAAAQFGIDPSSLAGLVPNVATPINVIGKDIDNSMHPDLHNIWVGAVTVQQPVFVGGKIIYSNQMASLAQDLAASQYDMKYADIIVDVDQAYWQIVSIANKRKLARNYSELLHQMEHDMDCAIAAGTATESDALQVKVKVNEADMMLTKAENGLTLAKMLLCKRIGMPLDAEIVLADENLEVIPEPQLPEDKSLEEIYACRPETRSLELAGKIYDKKAKVVRADMLPQVAVAANYLISNPNAFNGIQNNWDGGLFTVGVAVNVPLFHGMENLNRYKKAKAEASLYQHQYDDAKDLIRLQVTQQRKLFAEAEEKLGMSRSNLDNAEENLRKATVGFEAGVVPTNTVLAAQTAWLSAHSEYIDAGIELQMADANLRKAEGSLK